MVFRQSIGVNSQKTLVSTLSPTNVDSFFLIPRSHFCPTQQWGKAARPINVSISHMFACAAVFISTPSRPLAFAWQSSAYCWPISRCLQLILFHTKWEFLFSRTQVAQELPLSLWELQRDSSVDSFMYLHIWRADRKGPFCRTLVVASIRDDRGPCTSVQETQLAFPLILKEEARSSLLQQSVMNGLQKTLLGEVWLGSILLSGCLPGSVHLIVSGIPIPSVTHGSRARLRFPWNLTSAIQFLLPKQLQAPWCQSHPPHQLKVNTDDHGGNPWGGEVLQSHIRSHQPGESKSKGTGRALNAFWGFWVGIVASPQVPCENKRRCETSVNEPIQQTAAGPGKLLPRTEPQMRSPTGSPTLPVLRCTVSQTRCFGNVEHFKHNIVGIGRRWCY